MARRKQYWLMKSEPDDYSIDDLERDGSIGWTGVRNYQARNFMRDEMKVGDLVLYYHSNAKPPGVVGIAEVSREAYPDPTQFRKGSKYFDPKSTKDEPRWVHVDLKFVERFPKIVSLDQLKEMPELDGLLVLKRGQRLSIQPVEPAHFKRILTLGRSKSR
ncbi:MAG: EVE domain-containing protein [Phycisphaerales bacterium]|nr:MAG: EVE domain-containing protein [Phycisphaerales bacterium]